MRCTTCDGTDLVPIIYRGHRGTCNAFECACCGALEVSAVTPCSGGEAIVLQTALAIRGLPLIIPLTPPPTFCDDDDA